jgi:hypothetical protein
MPRSSIAYHLQAQIDSFERDRAAYRSSLNKPTCFMFDRSTEGKFREVVLRDRVERLALLRHFDVLELHRHSSGACFHDKRSSIENVNDLSGYGLRRCCRNECQDKK